MKDTSGLMKGAADSLQAGVLLKTRVVTCQPDVVPCRASTVQKPCRAFLKRTRKLDLVFFSKKKNTFWTSELQN